MLVCCLAESVTYNNSSQRLYEHKTTRVDQFFMLNLVNMRSFMRIIIRCKIMEAWDPKVSNSYNGMYVRCAEQMFLCESWQLWVSFFHELATDL